MYALAILLLAVEFFATSCARSEKSDVRSDDADLSAVERVESFVDESGFVISREQDGTPAHLGDSLLWTGMALGLLPCDGTNRRIEAGLHTMISENAGHLFRHPTDSSESDDGKFGVYWGLKRFLRKCGSPLNWAAALNTHRDTVSIQLHPMIDDILHDLGERDNITNVTRDLVGGVVLGWTVADVATRGAAYRVHLGFLILDQIGSGTFKDKFCWSAQETGMELIAAYCGNLAPLMVYAEHFKANEWEYKLQRSPIWEANADGNGLKTPGLDLLMAQDFIRRKK